MNLLDHNLAALIIPPLQFNVKLYSKTEIISQ